MGKSRAKMLEIDQGATSTGFWCMGLVRNMYNGWNVGMEER